MSEDERIVLKTFPNEMSAQLVAAELASEGIESQIMSDDAGGAIPALQTTQGVQLSVDKQDAEKARVILRAIEEEGRQDKRD